MTAASATLAGRQAAEDLMVDACTITRPATGPADVDPVTLQLMTPPGEPVYTGKCRVKSPNLRDKQFETEDRAVTVQTYVVSIPMSAVGPRIGDVVTMTASELDPAMPRRTFWIVDILGGSQVTARRMACREAAS